MSYTSGCGPSCCLAPTSPNAVDTLVDTLALVAALAAATAGILYLGRQVWRFFVAAQQVHDLLTHELNHNGGGSMKDDVAATAVAVGIVQRDLNDLARQKNLEHSLIQLEVTRLAALIEHHHPTHRKDPAHGPNT